MLPSSSSQLAARYGHLSHYKKFWLLQSTQVDKQEQPSTTLLSNSSVISLQASNGAATCINPTAAAKDINNSCKPLNLPSSLTVLNGDHLHAISSSQTYGSNSCRAVDNMATTLISRFNAGGCNSSYCSSNESSCVNSNYHFMNAQRYITAGHHEPAVMMMMSRDNGPRLSLAVNCGSASDAVKSVNHVEAWPPSTSKSCRPPLLPSDQQAQSSRGKLGALYDHEVCDSSDQSSMEVEKRSLGWSTSVSAPPSSCESPRTCTLCGTTKTPLWRSGPNGPKSLCNACGIRVKKTKRLEAAMQATATSGSSPSPFKGGAFNNKRKLSSKLEPSFIKRKRGGLLSKANTIHTSANISPLPTILPKQEGLSCIHQTSIHTNFSGTKWDFSTAKLAHDLTHTGKNPAKIFAKDVQEAAEMLMALSCGHVLT